jgi:hypothetical protein
VTQNPFDAGTRDPADEPADAADVRRRFVADGIAWSVRLIVNRYDRRATPDLVFESDAVVRRVRNYPANWRALSDEALFLVSQGV